MIISSVKKVIRQWQQLRRFPGTKIHIGCSVDKKSKVGKKVVLFEDVTLLNTQISPYSYIQKRSTLANTMVGRFCSIAEEVCIGPSNHPMTMVSTSPVFYDNTQPLPFCFVNENLLDKVEPKITSIGHDVWIGKRAIIMPGVVIGDGAVVGAGSVVTKNVAPYSIVAGVPANHIKWRFSDSIREQLSSANWWDFGEQELSSYTHLFHNPEAFLNKLTRDR